MKHPILAAAALTCMIAAPLAAEPTVYATPHDALMALVDAAQRNDRQAVLAVFGPENEDLISSGNAAEDRRNRAELSRMYHQGYRMEAQPDGSVVIALGLDAWPFPVPLAQSDDGWFFDAEAGRQEIQYREIGGNELDVIDLLDAYVDIQAAYRLTDHDGDGVMEFARRIISDAEDRDGLFWPGSGSPLGAQIARASAYGYNDGTQDHEPDPFHGYYFHILTSQTDAAPGGSMDYLVNGHMLAGHAILAVPSAYGETGIRSFMVSENGVILQADLGETTLETAVGIESYDPDESWTPID
ncbi:DUF2950 family protein [Rhodobacteraceae bacterium F11138]|nr:DUF2950 family protein [Rhodobacteraceae bacterium F11138]